MTSIIVGSGLAGVGAALALLERGKRVLMLDVGEDLEPERESLRRTLSSQAPEDWQEDALAAYCGPKRVARSEQVQAYGSEFPIRDSEEVFKDWPSWIGLRPSFSMGGLSRAWGAAIAPYSDVDLDSWPIRAADLTRHYDTVARTMGVPTFDPFDPVPPEFDRSPSGSLPLSVQARGILDRWEGHERQLARLGAWVIGARQAVSSDCKLCGLCQYGCPYQYIFTAAEALRRLQDREEFTYRRGVRVTRFEEEGECVRIRSTAGEFIADRLFVACGVLGTTQLVLSSLDRVDHPVTLLDSAHYFLPSLHAWSTSCDPSTEPKHTLAQLFVGIADPRLSRTTIHAQLYTYHDLFERDFRRRYGARGRLADRMVTGLVKRLVVLQCFLHSDHSRRIRLTLRKSGSDESLEPVTVENPATDRLVRVSRRRLARILRYAGLVPLIPFSRQGPVGSSFHCGGVFPMSRHPTGLQTDTLGTPAHLSRTHLVDASVFPSIPATTIGVSIMANAHRIGTLAA